MFPSPSLSSSTVRKRLTQLFSLDRQTEAIVSELLATEFTDWTVLVVAHRLETILNFDRVLVLEDGRVAEFGPPRELLEQGGAFRALWDAQL